MEFYRPGLKTNVKSDIYWSEIGSGWILENWVAHPHRLGFNFYFNFSVLPNPVSEDR